MRIALVNNFFLPRTSGSAHLTEGLARQFAADGHEVLVITAAQNAPVGEEWRDGYRVVRLKCWEMPETKLSMRYDVNFVASPRNIKRVFKLLDDFAPDVVHQHGQFFDLTWITALWCRRRKVPSALTVHTPLIHPSQPFKSLLWLGDEILSRFFLALGTARVIVVDRFMRDYVAKRYGLNDSEITVIPLGIDADKFVVEATKNVRKELGLATQAIVLSIGHVIPLRNRLGLIEALPEIVARHQDVRVVVAGNVLDDRFLVRAKELGVEENVMAVGVVPHAEVPSYFAAANVECHDLQGLGLGTSTLEVMAAGVPVVAVVRPDNFPGIDFEDGRDIAMVDVDNPGQLAEAINRILADDAFAEALGRGGQQFIRQHFLLEVVARRHISFFEVLDGEFTKDRQRGKRMRRGSQGASNGE